MTQSCKFKDPNIKNPKFGTYRTQLYKFIDRHWILLYDPSLISRFFFLLQFSPISKITFASVHTNEEGDYSCCTNLEGYFQCIFSTPSHKYIATYITKHASTH
jgi:hypothetical protein